MHEPHGQPGNRRRGPDLTAASYLEALRADADITNSFISIAREPPTLAAGGALEGVALAVKDNIHVAGFQTTCGSAFIDLSPEADPPLVRDLRAAGAVCVGKANMGELALEATNQNPHFGGVSNPRDLTRISGGSSGGSAAAVAAGLAQVALGTDSGGSVRIPAALCGVVGFRPTGASLSLEGIVGPAPSVDSYGVMANSTREIADVMGEVTAWNTTPRGEATTRTQRLAYLQDNSMGAVQPEIWARYEAAVQSLSREGHDLTGIKLEGLALSPYACAVIAYCEVGLHHRESIVSHPDHFSDAVRPLVQLGQSLQAHEYIVAQRARRVLARTYLSQTDTYDAVLTPTMPFVAPVKGEQAKIPNDDPTLGLFAFIRFTCLANLIDVPSISLPIGSSDTGLPVGLQLMGQSRQDWNLLALAENIEACVAETD